MASSNVVATTASRSQAISKLALFEEIGYEPHELQLKYHSARERFRVAAAGRRFGKSQMGAHELVPEAYRAYFMKEQLADQGKRHEYWIVGPEYSDGEKEFRVVYNDLKRLRMPFDKPGTYNNPLGGDMHISLWGGVFQVHVMSAKYPDSLVGEGLSGVILAEAAKLKPSIWSKYIRPTLADFRGWAQFTSTPEGRNWFYDLWVAGQDPANTEWFSMRAPSWMNPFVFPGGRDDPEIISMRDGPDMSAEKFNQEIGALFSEFVGRVFKDFDEELHVIDTVYNPGWETVAAADYGFTNPFVWLLIQIDPFGNVYVLDEIYESGLTIDEAATRIKEKRLCPPSVKKFYPDPASPGDTAHLERILRVRGQGGTGGELKDRIELIRRALKRAPAHLDDDHPAKKPKLFFDRKCVRTINDFNVYRYPETKAEGKNAPETPLKKDDHGPEAIGRFFAGYFGTNDLRRRPARVRQANMTGASR